ncbi:MAG TPA: PQQ-binding-like beta-propeller repeat protein [Verrucomicrobiae bacterium]
MTRAFLLVFPAVIFATQAAFCQLPGTKLWEAATPGEVISSPAVADDGTIYVGSGRRNAGGASGSAGWLYSFSPQGTTNWMLSFPAAIQASPAIGIDGRIYVGCYNGELKIVSPTGSYTNVKTGGYIVASPAIASDGTVYVASISNWFNKLFALTPDGAAKWVFNMKPLPLQLDSNQSSSPAIGPDGTIYVGSIDMNLYAINPDGTTKWVFPLAAINTTNASPTYASPAVGVDGAIYLGADNGIFYGIDPRGFARWKVQISGQFIESSAAVSSDGTIYFGSGSGQVCALNADGTRKWTFTSGGISASPALGSDGSIYVGSYGGSPCLYALSPWGTNLWRFPAPTYIFSSPAIGPDGTIYFGAGTNLYALYGTNAVMNSSWPVFRGNVRHTARAIQRAITKPTLRADGAFSMSVNIETGRTYRVEYSTNLFDWAELTALVSQTLTNEIIDTTATASPQRFYRLSTSLP